MKALRRIVLEEAVIGAVFLTGGWYVYYLIAIWGLLDHLDGGGLRVYALGPGIHIEMVLSGLGLGVLLAVVNHVSEVPVLRQKPFGQIILMKTGLYMMGLLIVGLLIHAVFLLFVFSWEEVQGLWALMSPRLLITLAAWMALNLLALTFLLEVRRKVGPGNLSALLTGKYHRPREEERVFLFLDLRGSTAIAERLGHARYSQFIRHCFHDLTEFVLINRAQIYQFVGDEVVLTWPAGNVDAGKHSVETFFGFQERLSEKRDWYEEEFGAAPEFRGGVERGVVTATEVGDIKREIAFHGDALNIAARLLELCPEYERSVLVSGRVQETIADEPGFSTDLQGKITLRGKTEPVAVYGVERAAASTSTPPIP
jgi:adenylate cyclase